MVNGRAGPFVTLVIPALLAFATLVGVGLAIRDAFPVAWGVTGVLAGVVGFLLPRYRVALGIEVGILGGYAVVVATTAAYIGESWFIPLVLETTLVAAASLAGVTLRLRLGWRFESERKPDNPDEP